MRSTRRRQAAVLLLVPAVLALAGCGNSGYETEDPPATVTTVSQPTVRELCGMLDSQKGTWRALGPEVANVAFLGAVRLWTVRDTAANAAIAHDSRIVDTVTGRSCPEVRSDTLAVLDVVDLETALIGF
ncbi:hypothetical protein ACFO5K_06405 [Nocardia halotolerans]|uniref:Lipoprotein n=1 Tax=Nocardia halotolerans TaxID=1755878 RepID=A0ABV8VE37_9NOCA